MCGFHCASGFRSVGLARLERQVPVRAERMRILVCVYIHRCIAQHREKLQGTFVACPGLFLLSSYLTPRQASKKLKVSGRRRLVGEKVYNFGWAKMVGRDGAIMQRPPLADGHTHTRIRTPNPLSNH